MTLGVLILDTRFPRLVGDPGNPQTYKTPAILKVVKTATVEKIVTPTIEDDVAGLFIEAAKELEQSGVTAITTSCGFLALLQDKLAQSVKIPVFTSTLLLVPLAYRLTYKPVGVLTANSKALTKLHFRKAGAENVDVRVKGLEEKPEFRRVILQNSPDMNRDLMAEDIVEATRELMTENPDIGSIVSECTNLTPFREEIRKTSNLPVLDYQTLLTVALSATGHKS